MSRGGGGARGSGKGRGSPSLLGTESGALDPRKFRGPTLVRFCAAFGDRRPSPAGRNSRQISAPSKFQVLANFRSWPLFSDTFPAVTFSALGARPLQRFLLSVLNCSFFQSWYGPPIPFISKYQPCADSV